MPNDEPNSPDWIPLTNAPYHLARKYDLTLERAVEFIADGLLRHPEFALTCSVYNRQTKQAELVPVGETRTRELQEFRNCVQTGTVRFRSGRYLERSELDRLCQAEGLAVPPMFRTHVRLCPAEPDIPLSDAVRRRIQDGLRLAGHALAPDVEARLFAGIESAANWYLRTPDLNSEFPNKSEARKSAGRLELAAGTLRDLLTEMQIPDNGQTAMHTELRKVLRGWNIELHEFERTLAKFAAATEELRLRVEERMPGRGKPRDDAAELLACEIADALRGAGITPSSYDSGIFEAEILPAVLGFVGAGAAGGRLHELARLAARSRPDDDG